MKREFPILWAKVSTFVATPLIIVVALLYMQKFISMPASESYGFGLSAVGITAALSAICFSAASPIGTATTPSVVRWAGEHFLHSCLLLIQLLILAFARDNILAWEWVTPYDGLKHAVEVIANTAGVFVASTAAWCWYWAFDELNKELWANWRQRIEEINRSRASAATDKAKESPNSSARPGNEPPV